MVILDLASLKAIISTICLQHYSWSSVRNIYNKNLKLFLPRLIHSIALQSKSCRSILKKFHYHYNTAAQLFFTVVKELRSNIMTTKGLWPSLAPEQY